LPASAADIPEEIEPDQTRQIEVYILIQGRHYMQNAKTFYELGDALGRAMAELLKNNP
jgi:Ser/Thr protein kinase RdoA (MazF antagonist)